MDFLKHKLPALDRMQAIVRTCFFLASLSAIDCAKRVDASLRARETIEKRPEITTKRRALEYNIRKLLQLTEGETLENSREMNTAVGLTVQRFQEKYNGIDVYDAVLTIRKNQHGMLTGEAAGVLVQDIAKDLPDTNSKLSDKDTLEIVAKYENVSVADIKGLNYERKIVLDEQDKAHLVNEINFLEDGVRRPYYMVDLNDGTIIKHWEGLTTMACCDPTKFGSGGNVKIGVIKYGDMPYCLSPTRKGDICYLENKYVRVIDMNHTNENSIVETANFLCTKGYEDFMNGAYSPALDAFFHGTVVGRMFEEWYNTTALGNKIVLRVHYGDKISNAFWNSKNCTFGDGDYYRYPYTSLDMVAHEIGHGVTEKGSGLEYNDEQGGINEAFSDIMGEAAEAFLLKSNMLVGSDIMKYQGYLREFKRPENDGFSIGHVSRMKKLTNPHYSSGVYRKVWWIIVNEFKIEIRDAFGVFLYANRMYWHISSSFYDASCGLKRAALDLGVAIYPFVFAFGEVGLEFCDISSHSLTLISN